MHAKFRVENLGGNLCWKVYQEKINFCARSWFVESLPFDITRTKRFGECLQERVFCNVLRGCFHMITNTHNVHTQDDINGGTSADNLEKNGLMINVF